MKVIHAKGQKPKMSNRVGNNSKVLKQMQCLSNFKQKLNLENLQNKLEIICIMT